MEPTRRRPEPTATPQQKPRAPKNAGFLFVRRDAANPLPIACRATNESAAFVRRAAPANAQPAAGALAAAAGVA
ncbi:hypothetical protein, partial [Burkholderia humptydooensis]